ncbi:MAG: GDP-mannose 4,6-dehydratase [Sphingomonadaceae bacterium]
MTGAVDLLVIGATGQDGYYLLDQARQHDLAVLGTSRRAVDGFAQVDPCKSDQLVSLLRHYAPDRIALLAGQSSVGRSYADPEGTILSHTEPLAACLKWIRDEAPGTRLVYAASGECFGPTEADKPASETMPFAPQNPYGEGKARGAAMVRKYRRDHGLHLANAFLFNHESPRRPEQFVFGKLLAGLARLRRDPAGAPIALGSLDYVRDWGWAPDYAAAMLTMTETERAEDLILATGRSVSLREAIQALVTAAGLDFDSAIACDTAPEAHAQHADSQYADPACARKTIGWTGSTPFPSLAEKLLKASR